MAYNNLDWLNAHAGRFYPDDRNSECDASREERKSDDEKNNMCATLRNCIEHIDCLYKYKIDEIEDLCKKLDELVGEYL